MPFPAQPSPASPPAGAAGEQQVFRGPDRRQRPTPRFSRYALWGGRRKHVRRADEREGSFVDVHGWPLLALAGWVALMNCADSFFTLYHLQAGGIELNPVADTLLKMGRESFVLWKCALITLALLVLCVHKNFALARLGLLIATLTYTLLVAYHLWLLRYV